MEIREFLKNGQNASCVIAVLLPDGHDALPPAERLGDETMAAALDYATDRHGAMLARIRPFSLLDRTNDDVPHGALDLVLTLELLSLTAHPLIIAPTSFALWGVSGVRYRPTTPGGKPAYATCEACHEAAPTAGSRGDIATSMPIVMFGQDALPRSDADFELTDEPLLPFRRRFGGIPFRLARREPLAGVLFTPEPDRLFVIADFSAS